MQQFPDVGTARPSWYTIVDLLPSWSMKPVVDALCVMRGINIVAARSILSATGDLRRFPTPTKLGAYFGLVPGEHSSGDSVHRLGITKRGNMEVRHVLRQSAWTYRFAARVTGISRSPSWYHDEATLKRAPASYPRIWNSAP